MSARAQCIVFANHKGGVGKTTSCLSVAACLAKAGQRVLVVDFEPQSDATSGLGIDSKTLRQSMYDVVLGSCDEGESVPIRKVIVETAVENLHLAPAELSLSMVEVLLQAHPQRTRILAQTLESIRPNYDFILIDTPTHYGLLMINGLCAAQQLIIPVDPSIYAVEALDEMVNLIRDLDRCEGHSFGRVAIVLVRYIKQGFVSRLWQKNGISRQVENSLKRIYDQVFVIPESPLFFEAQRLGVPVTHSAPTSAVVSAYGQLARTVQGGI